MKAPTLATLALSSLLALGSGLTLMGPAAAESDGTPVAGVTPMGVSSAEMAVIATGWSARRAFLGHQVHDDSGRTIGTIEDLIITPDKAISYAIIGAGGFLGLAKHDVAIPVGQLVRVDDRLVLPGATKAALLAQPGFEYTKRPRAESTRIEKAPPMMEKAPPEAGKSR